MVHRTWRVAVLGCVLLAGCATSIDGRAVSALDGAPVTPAPTTPAPSVPTTPPPTSTAASPAPPPPRTTPTIDLTDGFACLELITVVPPAVEAINAYAAVTTAEEAAGQVQPTRDAIATTIVGLQELALEDPPPSPELLALTTGMAENLDRLSVALDTDEAVANAAIDEFNTGYDSARELCTT